MATDISQVRGGNFVYLNDFERIVTVFDEEFQYLMTPIAYDVTLNATISFAFDVHDVYGVPDADTNSHDFELNLPTLFLSNRSGGGAVFVRLRPGGLVDYQRENRVADITVEYTLPDGTPVLDALTVDLPPLEPDENGDWFQDDHARRANLLLNTALTLRAAAEDMTRLSEWGYTYSDREAAIDRLTRFLDHFDAMAIGLEDRIEESSRSLSEERALIEQLLDNVYAW